MQGDSFVGCWSPGTGGGASGGSGSGGGVGTGGTSAGLPVKSIPTYEDNPVEASCNSEIGTREAYARWAAAHWRESHFWSFKAGMILIIHYDDGGSEKWLTRSPTSSDPILRVPLDGSLTCPAGVA